MVRLTVITEAHTGTGVIATGIIGTIGETDRELRGDRRLNARRL
jgi:hypothetical protein